MTVPAERPFLPTTDEVKKGYMKGLFGGNFASFVERNEYDLGFDQWLNSLLASERVAAEARRDLAEQIIVRLPHANGCPKHPDTYWRQFWGNRVCDCWKAEYDAAKEARDHE